MSLLGLAWRLSPAVRALALRSLTSTHGRSLRFHQGAPGTGAETWVTKQCRDMGNTRRGQNGRMGGHAVDSYFACGRTVAIGSRSSERPKNVTTGVRRFRGSVARTLINGGSDLWSVDNAGLHDASRRPHRSPRRISGPWRQRVAQLRRSHRRWGAGENPRLVGRPLWSGGRRPAERTIAGWLKESGLVNPQRRRARKGPQRFRPAWTRSRVANDVWTARLQGLVSDARRNAHRAVNRAGFVPPLLVGVCVLAAPRWLCVQAVFVRLFLRFGLPQVIRVDNGAPFGSTGPAGLSRLSAWWTALGIRVEFIAPGHPEQNGAHEQMHRVLQAETATPPARTKLGQQQRLRRWVRVYNGERSHAGLGQRTPSEFYRASRRPYVANKTPEPYGKGWALRRVRACGTIKWQGRERRIGDAFVGYRLGVKTRKRDEWGIYFGELLLGILRADDVGGLRPAAYVRRHRPTALIESVTHVYASNVTHVSALSPPPPPPRPLHITRQVTHRASRIKLHQTKSHSIQPFLHFCFVTILSCALYRRVIFPC